jgi:hypothetical protein
MGTYFIFIRRNDEGNSTKSFSPIAKEEHKISKILNMLDPHRKVYLNIEKQRKEKKREEKNTIITKSFCPLYGFAP